jgi:Flp pilus assembly protein TadG
MTRTLRVRLGAGLFTGAAALSLAACGTTIPASSMEKQVTDFVSQNTEATAKDVKCPDNTDAKVGGAVDCTFSADDGDYTAHVVITKVDGTDVYYNISTKHK